jgi:D-aminopeptidase
MCCGSVSAWTCPRSSPRHPSVAIPAAADVLNRRRLRDLGYSVGRFPVGPRNALVDVPGVRVGHVTLLEDLPDGQALRTGVTAVLPHGGNVHAQKVLGACHVINGHGKATGLAQLAELGTLESPILVTNTLSVGAVWEGGLRHVLEQNPDVGRDQGTVNVVVAECFDGYLSDARGLHVRPEHALAAIAAASEDEVSEGAVGAGTGTTCFEFKAGVGTASRLTLQQPACVLGGLAVTNYGRRADLHLLVEAEGGHAGPAEDSASGGSVIVVLATDAPLSERQLRRLAARAQIGLARAGSFASNPSGDYVFAFSTVHRIPHRTDQPYEEFRFLRDDSLTLRELFEAAGEVTAEAVLNSLCVADAMNGRDGHRAEAFPYELLGRVRWPQRLA